jgi:hypothetical protein
VDARDEVLLVRFVLDTTTLLAWYPVTLSSRLGDKDKWLQAWQKNQSCLLIRFAEPSNRDRELKSDVILTGNISDFSRKTTIFGNGGHFSLLKN